MLLPGWSRRGRERLRDDREKRYEDDSDTLRADGAFSKPFLAGQFRLLRRPVVGIWIDSQFGGPYRCDVLLNVVNPNDVDPSVGRQ